MLKQDILYKYSIHTFELYANLTLNDYDNFYSTLSKMHLSVKPSEYFTKKLNIPTKNMCYEYRHFKNHPGINRIRLSICENEFFTSYGIQICINPYNALYQCRHSGADIITDGEIGSAMDIVRTYLESLFPCFPFHAYSLKRLDFCLDIKYSTQKQADEYIKLLKKSIPRKILKEKKYFNKTQHRFTPYADSMLLECKSYSFEVYPKYHQMKKHKRKNANTALGICRLELRTSKSKIMQLASKYSLPSPVDDLAAFMIRSPEITRKEIPEMISKMAGCGTFQTYNYIITQINNSAYTPHAKDCMAYIVDYFSSHKNCKDLLNNPELKRQDWNEFLKKFNKLGCSPIPIPRTYEFSSYPGVSDWDAMQNLLE